MHVQWSNRACNAQHAMHVSGTWNCEDQLMETRCLLYAKPSQLDSYAQHGNHIKVLFLHVLMQVPKAHDNRPAISLQSAMQSTASGVLLSCSAKNELRLFSFSGKQLASVDASGLHNHMAAISTDGRFLAAATFTSDVKVICYA